MIPYRPEQILADFHVVSAALLLNLTMTVSTTKRHYLRPYTSSSSAMASFISVACQCDRMDPSCSNYTKCVNCSLRCSWVAGSSVPSTISGFQCVKALGKHLLVERITWLVHIIFDDLVHVKESRHHQLKLSSERRNRSPTCVNPVSLRASIHARFRRSKVSKVLGLEEQCSPID